MAANLVEPGTSSKDRPTNMPVLITRCKSHADVVLSLNQSKHSARVDMAKLYTEKLNGLSGDDEAREVSEVLGSLTTTEKDAKSNMERFEKSIVSLKVKGF